MSEFNARFDDLLAGLPVLPVVTVDTPEAAVGLGRVLAGSGLGVIEVTLRTPRSLDAIRAMRDEVDGLIVGAGTVRSGDDLMRAQEAGAQFAVSPGTTPSLYRAAAESPLPLLPGVSTATEIARGLEAGWTRFKFFPAEAAGGVAALRAFAGPFAQVRFCPTGGIGADNAGAYRRLGNVLTVGGSWMVPAEAVKRGDWDRIEALARECVEQAALG